MSEVNSNELTVLAQEILKKVGEYHRLRFANSNFIPGVSRIDPSGKTVGLLDLQYGVQAVLDGWWTEGRYARELQNALADYIGTKSALLTNSGSSANLLALFSLTSPELGDRALKPGDEVITVATGFPTTVNPIVQAGCVPVFLDLEPIEVGRYNIDISSLEEALSSKTKAIMIAHTLGNPFDVDTVLSFAKKHKLWLIEDTCDALGSTYDGKRVGSFGDIATLSCYPAHHITMGEGGAIFSSDPQLVKIIKSFRNWGRHCWCEPGCDNTCGKRFGWQLGRLPFAYDHKNSYSHIGFNLKATDMQAAIGLAQLRRIDEIVIQRKENFQFFRAALSRYESDLILPTHLEKADPSWFGFLITVREGSDFSRNEIVNFLGKHKILTRDLFAGNITRQPSFKNVNYRIIGDLRNADYAMNRTFWIGVQPAVSSEMREYVAHTFDRFFEERTAKRTGDVAVSDY